MNEVSLTAPVNAFFHRMKVVYLLAERSTASRLVRISERELQVIARAGSGRFRTRSLFLRVVAVQAGQDVQHDLVWPAADRPYRAVPKVPGGPHLFHVADTPMELQTGS